MKILMLVSSMHTGGAERVASTLASAWADRGDEVLLVPTYSGRGECAYPLSPGVRLQWLADTVGRGPRLIPVPLRKLRGLRQLVCAERPDVIVSLLTNVNVVVLAATWGLRVPLIVCERTDPSASRNIGTVLRRLRHLLYPRADALVVQTAAAADWFRRHIPALRDIAVVPNPLPPELAGSPGMVAPDGEAGRRTVVAMGRLVATKQFDRLIHVFAGLAPEFPDWDLCICGEGPMRDELEALRRRSGVAGRIVLPGRTKEPWAVLARSDLFVMTSAVEGFPNVLLEAMALGLPCIAYDCPSGPADVSAGGRDAVLVPLDDEAALMQALRDLMGQPGLREDLGRRAQSVRVRYRLDRVLEAWDGVFRRVQPPSRHMPVSGRPLLIVHIISGLLQGGAETVLHRLVSAPTQSDRNIVISMTDEGVFGPRLREAGIELICLNMPYGRLSPGGLYQLWRLLRRLRPDVVQTWMYHADLVGGIVARLAGLRAVAWGIRNSGDQLQRSSRVAKAVAWLCARVSGRVPALIVSCAEDAARRHQEKGYPASRMQVIPNGYDLARWRPDAAARQRLRAEWGLAPDAVVVGSVSRWNPLKDHENLIDAFARCASQDERLRCVLVGLDLERSNSDLMALLDRHGVRDKMLLLGMRSDVPAIMNALDIHLLSSRAEGFPNVVAEAMATGIPCVVTDVGDARHIVGDLGWVAPPEDAAALASALADAVCSLGTPEQSARVREGRERMERLFSLDAMVQAYHRAWLDLARARGPYGGRLLFVVNNPAFFLSHRLPVALAARSAGYEVHVATMAGPAATDIREAGLIHHAIPLSRSGKNPLREVASMAALWRLMRRVRPDLVHAVTIKPVLYGGIAARLAGVPAYIAAVSGLGFLYTDSRDGFHAARWAATRLYGVALRHPCSRVIFQNEDDRTMLEAAGVLRRGQAVLVRGSGVDLSAFSLRPQPEGAVTVVMASRLLRDKGVGEFVEAARMSRRHGAAIRWVLAGSPDPANPASITDAELSAWKQEGIVELVGECRDIAGLYAAAHIVVLPSYREGLPKSLVEAAACGRAVVTTDVAGCRDAIEAGITGLLIPVRDAAALERAVRKLAEDQAMRLAMGAAGRRLAERDFDIRKIVAAHLQLYEQLMNSCSERQDQTGFQGKQG